MPAIPMRRPLNNATFRVPFGTRKIRNSNLILCKFKKLHYNELNSKSVILDRNEG